MAILNGTRRAYMTYRFMRASEANLAKVGVAGSNPFARSKFP